MNPSIDLRIRSMLRALQETVIPALDPSDALAREQAGLLVGHLHALSIQHADLRPFPCTKIGCGKSDDATTDYQYVRVVQHADYHSEHGERGSRRGA